MVKKIGLGVGFWAIMFIGISALMVTPLPEIWQKILGIVLSGVAAYILGMIYFKKTPGDIKDGLILGGIWFVTSLVLDLLVTIQYVKANVGGGYVDGLKAFYGSWNLWVGIVLMFVGIIVAVKTTHGGEIMKQPPAGPAQQPPSQPTSPPQPPASPAGGPTQPTA